MSRFLYNYINDHLQFSPFKTDRKRHVTAVNGAITSYLRKRWGINKVREDGDLHHAMDALVIACTTDGMIQRLSRYSELHESEYMQTEDGSVRIDPQTGELLEKFPYPWACRSRGIGRRRRAQRDHREFRGAQAEGRWVFANSTRSVPFVNGR